MISKIKKITSFLLISILLFLQYPHFSFAQLFSGSTPANPTYTLEVPQSPLTTGTAAIVANTATIIGQIGIPATAKISTSVVDAACTAADKASQGILANVVNNASTFSFIGGSDAESAALTKSIATLTTLRACKSKELEVLKATPILTILQGQELTRQQAKLDAEINALDIQLQNLKARQSQTFKDVMKAVSVKLLLTFSQKLTTRLVNMLIAKYKIGNYLKYADAVATQVYEKQYITQNYPNKSNQLILASMLNSPVYQGVVLPSIQLESRKALGFAPSELVVSDPNYWIKMAQVGSGQANPYFMQTVYDGRADLAKAVSQYHSQSELSQGTGFVPVRNCAGSVAQQNDIYRRNIELSFKADSDRQILEKLQAQFAANPNSIAARKEMETAADNLGKSEDALKKLPTEIDSPIVEVCSAITNPGGFMGRSISDLFKSQIDKTTLLQTDNLPFYGQFILSVASSLLNDVLEGGHNNLKILTDSGINAANILSVDYLKGLQQPTTLQDASKAAENGGAFLAFDDIDPAQPQPAGTYNLKWDASKYPDIRRAEVVGVSGVCVNVIAGKCDSIVNYSGLVAVKFSLPGVYDFQLRIFTTSNQTTTPDKVITARIGIAQNPPALVQGASITKAVINIRGSEDQGKIKIR